MIRHLLRLIWNRKRANALVIVEIFLAFLVVFFVATLGLSFWRDLSRPVGFAHDNVWYLTLNADNERFWYTDQIPVLQQVLRELARMPEVAAATAADGLPFDGNTNIHANDDTGVLFRAQHVTVTPGFSDVFRIALVAGRWFEESDAALAYSPVVVDRDMVRAVFGEKDPLGQTLPIGRFRDERRVIGVVDEFRKDGELGKREVEPFVFEMAPPTDTTVFLPNFAIRLAAGTEAGFEEELTRRVEALAPEWSVHVQTLDLLRRSKLRLRIAPLAAFAIVAAFLLMMVALGLLGVLWQNVTRRTHELGLRRAVGAHRGQVHRQILIEVLWIASLGAAAGLIVVVQLPLLQLLTFLTPGVLLGGALVSLITIFALAIGCGLYPGWLATQVEPAEALHHE